MFIDKALELTKKNRVVIGFDLWNDFSQISYCRVDQSMPDTLSMVVGEEQYNIPTVLCRIPDDEKTVTWLIGKDAQKAAQDGQGTLVQDLLLLAEQNGSICIEEDEYNAEMLLELYMRKAVALLAAYIKVEDICAIAFTMKEMKPALMHIIRKAAGRMRSKKMEIYFLSHEDCFFQYMIHQPQEMWVHNVLLYDYGKDGITSYSLQMNRKTNPVACFIAMEEYPQMKMLEVSEMTEEAQADFFKQLDTTLLEITTRQCEEQLVSSVFLLGDYFSKDWCQESLKYMCRNRRVFQGSNLFSKGACYGARERVMPSTLSTSYVYLSDDKLRANIGMKCDKGREEIYLPILHAGTNWYDAKMELDVMLVKNNTITLVISPVDGGKVRIAQISLEGLTVRGNKTNRVGLLFFMEDAQFVQIEIRDKGFGEIFPSTGQVWRECLPLEFQ